MKNYGRITQVNYCFRETDHYIQSFTIIHAWKVNYWTLKESQNNYVLLSLQQNKKVKNNFRNYKVHSRQKGIHYVWNIQLYITNVSDLMLMLMNIETRSKSNDTCLIFKNASVHASINNDGLASHFTEELALCEGSWFAPLPLFIWLKPIKCLTFNIKL